MNLQWDDPLISRLTRLSGCAPDAAHRERIRVRCHAALTAQRRRNARVRAGRTIELAAACGATMAYLSMVIHQAFW